jgi:hypothetical protein
MSAGVLNTRTTSKRKGGRKSMKNVETKIEGSILTIRVDLSKTHGASKSGNSIVIATTEGNAAISPGVMMGLNVYKKA